MWNGYSAWQAPGGLDFFTGIGTVWLNYNPNQSPLTMLPFAGVGVGAGGSDQNFENFPHQQNALTVGDSIPPWKNNVLQESKSNYLLNKPRQFVENTEHSPRREDPMAKRTGFVDDPDLKQPLQRLVFPIQRPTFPADFQLRARSRSRSPSSVQDFENEIVVKRIHFHTDWHTSNNSPEFSDIHCEGPVNTYNRYYGRGQMKETSVSHICIKPGSFLAPSTQFAEDTVEVCIAPIFQSLLDSTTVTKTSIYNFPFHLVDSLLNSSPDEAKHKMECIKSFSFDFVNYGPLTQYDVAQLKKVAALSPRLESIKIFRTKFEDYPEPADPADLDCIKNIRQQEWNEALSQILNSSSSSLKVLEIQSQSTNNPQKGLVYPPKFPALESLTLDGDVPIFVKLEDCTSGLFLPASVNLNSFAPNLKKFEVKLDYCHSCTEIDAKEDPALEDPVEILQDAGSGSGIGQATGVSTNIVEGDWLLNKLAIESFECPQILLGSCRRSAAAVLPSVRTLKVGRQLPRSMLQNLHTVFPLVTVLDMTVWSAEEFGAIASSLFLEWTLLKELTVRFDGVHKGSRSTEYPNGFIPSSFPVFDEILTGIPEAVLERLRRLPQVSQPVIECFRIFVPLSNLKNLQKLRMSFNLVYNRPTARLLFTRVTQMYCFASLPQLQVEIGYKDCLKRIQTDDKIYCLEEIEKFVRLERQPAWMTDNE